MGMFSWCLFHYSLVYIFLSFVITKLILGLKKIYEGH